MNYDHEIAVRQQLNNEQLELIGAFEFAAKVRQVGYPNALLELKVRSTLLTGRIAGLQNGFPMLEDMEPAGGVQ